MAKATPLFGTFWTDRDTRRMSAYQKLVYLFLITHDAPGSGVSGVYRVLPEDVAYYTGIPQKDVVAMLKKGIQNIMYDGKHDIVFVKNKLRFRLGGRPDLNAASVAADYKLTSVSAASWAAFKSQYAQFVELAKFRSGKQWVQLRDVLSGVPFGALANGCSEDAASDARDNCADETTELPDPPDYDVQCENYLAKYKTELDEDDFETVLIVYKHLATDMRKKSLLPPARRCEMLNKWSKKPAIQIARAAYEFVKGGCIETRKRENYFWGIVEGSALSWFIEYRAEKDKANYQLKGEMAHESP